MRPSKFAISIGVNAPLGNRPLRFASRDARALAYHFRSGRGGSFHANDVECLLDWGATVQGVEDAIGRVPEFTEFLVITFSGHGNRYGIQLQDGFLPFDVLAEWLRQTCARRKLVIIDSCGAGGLISHGPGLGDHFTFDRDEPFDAAIFNSLEGARVLTSCAQSQNAHEYSHLKHGVFTWLLLESRKYLHGGPNDMISVEEALAFAKQGLRQLGNPQVPQEYGPLRGFPFSRSGRYRPIGTADIQAALTPSFPNPTNHASIGIQANIVGRRRLQTYLDVYHETGGHWVRSGTQPVSPDYHETVVTLSVDVPLQTFPRLTQPGYPQSVTTRIRLRDEANRVLASQDISWQVTRYGN